MKKALSAFAERVRGVASLKRRKAQRVHDANEHSFPCPLEKDKAEITAQLQLMFPQLTQNAISGVLSELLNMYPNCSPNQLVDLATSSLLEVRLRRAQTQTHIAIVEDVVPGMVQDDSNAISAPNNHQHMRLSTKKGFIEDLDYCLANMFMIPEPAMAPCMAELKRILQKVAAEPNGLYARDFAQYSSSPQFMRLVGRYQPAVALLCLAGFEEEGGGENGRKIISFIGDSTSEAFTAVLATLQGVTEEKPSTVQDMNETGQSTVQDAQEIVSRESLGPTQHEQRDGANSLTRKPSRLTQLAPLPDLRSGAARRNICNAAFLDNASTPPQGRADDIVDLGSSAARRNICNAAFVDNASAPPQGRADDIVDLRGSAARRNICNAAFLENASTPSQGRADDIVHLSSSAARRNICNAAFLENASTPPQRRADDIEQTSSFAANWGVAKPALLSSKEQCQDTTNFELLLQKALDGTNLHRAKKGLAPLTSLRSSSELAEEDIVTIPASNPTNPKLDDGWTKPAVSEGTWTAQPEKVKKAKPSHAVPAIFSGKAKLRGAKGAKAPTAHREKQVAGGQ